MVALGALTVLATLFANTAWSAEIDNRQAVDIDGCNYTEQSGELIFRGCFELLQGSRKIRSTSAKLIRDDNNQFQSVHLSGAPATWEEVSDDGAPFQAQARQIDYDVQQQMITLNGDVVVKQGEREISSQQMRYDLRTGRVEGGDANDPDSRVRMRFPAQVEPEPALEPTGEPEGPEPGTAGNRAGQPE